MGGVLVAQLGARMHYAVPRILNRAGLLWALFTDISVPRVLHRLVPALPISLRRSALRRVLTRLAPDIPAHRVRSVPWFGIDYWRRIRIARTASEQSATYLWGGREFCRLILRHGLGSCDSVYTFNAAGLELLRFARRDGLFTIMEQTIAPKFVEQRLLEEESALWPSWDAGHLRDNYSLELAERERDEWGVADLVVCGSDFVAEGVRQFGGSSVVTEVVPYGVDLPILSAVPPKRGGALRVLFCGTVGLRKGVQYLLQAAARLNSRRFEFRVVGPISLGSAAIRDVQSTVELVGGIPRFETQQHYGWADVFVLPSLCEGSATVCYEALASGLPVITTPNAGSVVRDGIDGFIVPIRDADAIAARLETLLYDPSLLDELSRNARERAREFTVAKYGERLLSVVRNGFVSRC